MRIKVTGKGIYGAKGEIAIGKEFTVKEIPAPWKGKVAVISGGEDEKFSVTNPAGNPDPVGSFEAKDKGNGWWAIFDAEGKEVSKGIREADAVAFNELSDEDKLSALEELKP